jgi:predicted permease
VSLLSRFAAAWRNLFRRARVERELDDEVRAYVDLIAAENIARGMPPDAARRAALVEAGGVEQTKEEVRDTRAGAWLDAVGRDVRHTLRGLARAPGFTVAVVATLAIGIGFNSALFTVVYAALARPLPVRDASRTVNVYQRLKSGGHRGREVRGASWLVSYREFQRYAELPAFASAAAYYAQGLTVSGVENHIVSSELVTCGYFRTLEVRFALGRGFTDEECAHPGSGPVAVVSDASWHAWYGADSSVIGRVVHVNGSAVTIVGVTEPGFGGVSYQRASMWLPLTLQPTLEHGRDSILVRDNASWLTMVARLAPDATLAQARAQAAVTGSRLDAAEPGQKTIPTVVAGAFINFPEVSTQGGLPLALTFLLGLTIVAIAGANVMNLLLARGLARGREISIRLAIGASRRQLVRELLVESGVLSFSGAVIGFAFVLAVSPTKRLLSPMGGLQVNVSPDLRVVAYVFLVAIVTTMMIGLTPALQTTRVDLATAFKDGGAFGTRGLRPSRIRSVIVGVQMAGGAMLLAIAGLFVRGALRAMTADPGYATHNVVAFSTNAAPLGYDAPRATILYRQLMDRIRRTPGVLDVAIVGRLPLLARNSGSIRVDRGTDTAVYVPDIAVVSASYFHTMGMRIVRGSTFDTAAASGAKCPVIVSGSLATILWPQQEPLGQRLKSGDYWFRVVGIASEAATSSLERTAEPTVYFQAMSPLERSIVVRTSASPTALIAAVPGWARELDPALMVQSERFEDRIALVLLPGRFVAATTAVLGLLALLLAAIGIAGVVSFGVGQRRREIAVRLAVGATARQVVALMMQQGSRPIVAGVASGLTLAVGLGFVARRFLFGVSPLDPIAYLAMAAPLAVTAFLATYLPSRRAAHIDPASTLRDDG